MTSRVFVTEDLTSMNLANLDSFGEIEFVFTQDLHPSLWEDTLEEKILEYFITKSFDPDVDYYAVSGRMVLSHIALASLVDRFGEVTCLVYDKISRSYKTKQLGGLT